MKQQLLDATKALRTLRKTPIILEAVLAELIHGQTRIQDVQADGWNIVDIVGHLREYEAVVGERVRLMLAHDHPMLPVTGEHGSKPSNADASAHLRMMLSELRAERQRLLNLLEQLRDDQWLRTGVHPRQGAATVLDVALNAGLHDIDHIEQIVQCLTRPLSFGS